MEADKYNAIKTFLQAKQQNIKDRYPQWLPAGTKLKSRKRVFRRMCFESFILINDVCLLYTSDAADE